MISPNFEAMYNYRFLHVLLLMFLLRCPIQHISEMLQSKNNKKTHHQPWIQVNKMVPPFLFANISKSLGFLSHGISSSQRSLFGVELPRWHVCLRSKHQHGWKARSLFFCWWFFLRIPSTIWVRISILLHGFFRLQFKQSQKSHVFVRNYTWVNDNGYSLFYGSFRNGVFQPLFALEKGDGSLESGTPGETDGWRSGQ